MAESVDVSRGNESPVDQSHVLFAPLYLLVSVLSGSLFALVLYGVMLEAKSRQPVDPVGCCILVGFASLLGLALLYLLGRAVVVVSLTTRALRITNGRGATILALDADSPKRAFAFTRKNDSELDAVIEEKSFVTKAIGLALRAAFFLGSRYSSSRSGTEEFVVLTARDGEPRARAILPDVYSWNLPGYVALKGWLADHQFELDVDEVKLDDPRVRGAGWIWAVLAVFLGLGLPGSAIVLYLSSR